MATRRDWSRAPSIGYLVWHLALRWRLALDRTLEPLGLTHARYALMASLSALSREGRRPSQRELAEFSGLEPMFVSKLARVLERKGLLVRADDPTDPRAFQVSLTDRGAEVVRSAAAMVQALHDRLLAPIGGRSSPRSAVLARTLGALVERADSLAPEASGHQATGRPVDLKAATPTRKRRPAPARSGAPSSTR